MGAKARENSNPASPCMAFHSTDPSLTTDSPGLQQSLTVALTSRAGGAIARIQRSSLQGSIDLILTRKGGAFKGFMSVWACGAYELTEGAAEWDLNLAPASKAYIMI